ncbi:MAG: hypothetical protein LUO81_01615 [Methanoregulaceae archaeon]|nr:hypothetical protein [Methanoregulaceae archaeon]
MTVCLIKNGHTFDPMKGIKERSDPRVIKTMLRDTRMNDEPHQNVR